jgi:acetylornithine deacetylase/succinyl-diaminopimelate desuccinylase-like protein
MKLAPMLEADRLLETLVRIDSRNPDLAPDSQGERPVAEAVAQTIADLGLETRLDEVVDGRPNVIGVLSGDDGMPTYVLEAHLDTVPTPPGGITVQRADGAFTDAGVLTPRARSPA